MNKLIIILCSALFISHSLLSDWEKINSYPMTLVKDILVNGGIIYTASTGGVHKSTDGTLTWQTINNGLNNTQSLTCKQIIIDGSNFYIATVDGIYKSTNSGANWVKKSNGIVIGGGALYEFCESIFELNNNLFTGANTGIYRSTNFGETWIPTNITGSGIMTVYFINYNGILFAARENINPPGSYKSTDNGITWNPFAITGAYLPAITFYDDGTRFYAGTIHGVWLSTNNGLNWAMKNNGLSADPYSSSIIRVNNVLITSLKFGGSGIYISYNNGDQWLDFKQGFPFLNEINKVNVFNNKLLAGTSGGIYQRNVSELTGITTISNEIPEKYMLMQNYPNPFNPNTVIGFQAAINSNISLKVYDLQGREISVLVNEQLSPGTYRVTFDAADLPSGVYYYLLQAGDFKETRKMVLVK